MGNSRVGEQFAIERSRARTIPGLGARLYRTLATHAPRVYLSRLPGKIAVLRIKHLALDELEGLAASDESNPSPAEPTHRIARGAPEPGLFAGVCVRWGEPHVRPYRYAHS